MDSDERDIYEYLKTWGKEFVGVKEICRRAGGKKRYHEDTDWAIPYLGLMTERGLLERDHMGRFRVKPKPKTKSGGRWLSPQIAEILKSKADVLKEKGVEVESAGDRTTPDEDPEQP
jgi:hypothetical protein